MKRRRVHRMTGSEIDALAERKRLENLREEAELQKARRARGVKPERMKIFIRPRSPLSFTAKAKATAKKLLADVKEWGGRKRGKFRSAHRLRAAPTRSQTPWQFGLPGIDRANRKPYTGAPLARIVLRDDAPKESVIALREKPGKAARAPSKKATIRELEARGIKLRLKPAPYSDESLTAGDFTNLQPYKGGWLVTSHGVSFGSVKRLKSGWKKEGYFSKGSATDKKLDELTELLDEYYAAGGK